MKRIVTLIAGICFLGLANAPQFAFSQEQIARATGVTALSPIQSPELARLSRYVGRWSVTMHRKSESKTIAATSDSRWILDGRYIQATYQGDGINGMMLTTYDQAAKVYRRWQFDSAGSVTEFTGRWDDAANTLHFEHTSKDKAYRIVVESICSPDQTRETFSIVVKDRDGQELDEFSGSSQRIR